MREQSGRKECFFMPKYKAAAYIRLSYTDDHSSESDSVSNQRKLIENFVERNPDIEVVSEKIDDGYSGIIFDRPAFKEKQDEQARQDSRKEASKAIFDADTLTSELAELLIDRVLVYPDKRMEIAYKIRDIFD